MDLGDLNKVWEVKVLKKPGQDEARDILNRITKQVQPIMRKHKWKVKLLLEFCPTNPALLGLNVGGGLEVKLRLRRPKRDWEFLPYEQVLDTMLHELCHIDHGPHNAAFYKLWDEIRKECEDLIARGVTGTGQGFDLPGRRLGGFSRQPPLSSLRQTMLAAAEKRQRVGSLLPHGPRRLGGDSDIMTALSPIQAAAMAAERRMHDDLWCGSSCSASSSSIVDDYGGSENFDLRCLGTRSASSSFSGKRSFDTISKNKEHADGGVCEDKSKGINSGVNQPISSFSTSGRQPCGRIPDSSSIGHPTNFVFNEAPWECGICTLVNQPLSLVCEACGIQKPKDVTSKSKVWSCKFCTLDNGTELDKCSACEQWRYSTTLPCPPMVPFLTPESSFETIDIRVAPGTHSTEAAVNKQLSDK